MKEIGELVECKMQRTQRFFLTTFGCQMNTLDSEILHGVLLSEGLMATSDKEQADIIIINTCSVRQHAENKVYSLLGYLARLKRKKKRLLIAVMGCMAQKEGNRLVERGGVDIVCGTRNFTRLPELIRTARRNRVPLVCNEMGQVLQYERNVAVRPDKFRAYVAVMRGCNNFCSYCVVPNARGPEVSRPKEEVVDEARRLVDDGCKEIILLGQNVDSYGRSLNPPSRLSELLRVLDRIGGLERIRFVTSHPKDLDHDLLDAVAELPSVCEHIHLPAQSGSDRILKAMNRGYTAEGYRGLITEAREKVHDLTFTSDFIVGFPGETDGDFEQTVELMRTVRFLNSFIFKYSPRPGTGAYDLRDDVPLAVKKQRNQLLLQHQQEISAHDNRLRAGKTLEVLVEGWSKRNPKRLTGRTRQNHIVIFDGNEELIGRIVKVAIESSTALSLYGRVVNTADNLEQACRQ